MKMKYILSLLIFLSILSNAQTKVSQQSYEHRDFADTILNLVQRMPYLKYADIPKEPYYQSNMPIVLDGKTYFSGGDIDKSTDGLGDPIGYLYDPKTKKLTPIYLKK